MPYIPYPNVPEYPAVPPLVRPVSSAIASLPVLAIGIVSLKEMRQATATYSRVPIVNPQNPAATPQVNNGMTQPSPLTPRRSSR